MDLPVDRGIRSQSRRYPLLLSLFVYHSFWISFYSIKLPYDLW